MPDRDDSAPSTVATARHATHRHLTDCAIHGLTARADPARPAAATAVRTAGTVATVPSVAARRPVAWVALVVVAGVALLGPEREADRGPGAAMAALVAAEAAPRTLDPYEGLGAWIDVFDYAPAYQGGGAAPPLDVGVVDDMAAAGVRTLFLQAARADERSPEGIVDPALVSRLLVRSHQAGLRVVAWYLPTFDDVDRDVRRVEQLLALEVLGHRFDGVALDIELTEAVPDHAERNRRLVELSTRVRAAAGDATLGAIVLPPVQLEVVNPALWPEFPWGELAPLYDVWLPMSYWTFRSDDSGYGDGYAYNEESTRRLRERVDDPATPVHGIGGIGDEAPPAELDAFVRSLVDTDSVGGSIYDWNTLDVTARALLADRLGEGVPAD